MKILRGGRFTKMINPLTHFDYLLMNLNRIKIFSLKSDFPIKQYFLFLTEWSKIDPALIFITLLTIVLVTIFIIPDKCKKLYEGLKRKLLISDTWRITKNSLLRDSDWDLICYNHKICLAVSSLISLTLARFVNCCVHVTMVLQNKRVVKQFAKASRQTML